MFFVTNVDTAAVSRHTSPSPLGELSYLFPPRCIWRQEEDALFVLQVCSFVTKCLRVMFGVASFCPADEAIPLISAAKPALSPLVRFYFSCMCCSLVFCLLWVLHQKPIKVTKRKIVEPAALKARRAKSKHQIAVMNLWWITWWLWVVVVQPAKMFFF